MVWTELFDKHQTASPTINGSIIMQILPSKRPITTRRMASIQFDRCPMTNTAFQVLGLGHIQGQENQF